MGKDSPFHAYDPHTKRTFKDGKHRLFIDPVKFPITCERELRDEFKRKFPGQFNKIMNWVMFEFLKGKPRVIFDMQYPGFTEEPRKLKLPAKVVACLDPETLQEVARYQSLGAASRATKINYGHIGAVCRGSERKLAGGYVWRYVDEDPSIGYQQPKLDVKIHYDGMPCGYKKVAGYSVPDLKDVTCKRCIALMGQNPDWKPLTKAELNKKRIRNAKRSARAKKRNQSAK